MKLARVTGNTVNYYAKPKPRKDKRVRWYIKIDSRECKWAWVAELRKWIYEKV